jgi:hypothetical protein
MYAKLIMDQITDENERYYIYWNAWKKCASEVENDSAFTKYTSYFVNDLVNGPSHLKTSIESEMLVLMKSDNPLLATRVKNLHSLFLLNGE